MTRLALIVDDCKTARVWIRRVLRETGFECIEAGTVREAMSLLSEKPELVAVDYELPGVTGVELVKAIRACDRNIRILMISAHDLERYASKLGCDGFVTKGDVVGLRTAMVRLYR